MLNTSKSYKNFTVLYVEDEHIIRDNVERCLKFLFNVVIAKNGQEGLEKFNNENIDLVITDINMPLKDGFSMLRDIKLLNPTLPCIVTSSVDMDLVEMAKSIGICKYISKPFDMEDLLKNSVELLENS
eukprot:gnl/Chilomastix_cuspidata/9837.p1 GENE.gnl/Chilomastix_cuspidata/9837~~gnl/Chilomastix_cuspidata/9837.p1  ORF type:complete len:128 (+),score=19.53 gnl/Chilomastix_cuspidata/9837:3-386(+)